MIGRDSRGVKGILMNTFANWHCKDACPHSVSLSEMYRWYLFSAHKTPLWLPICETNSQGVKQIFLQNTDWLSSQI